MHSIYAFHGVPGPSRVHQVLAAIHQLSNVSVRKGARIALSSSGSMFEVQALRIAPFAVCVLHSLKRAWPKFLMRSPKASELG